MEYLAQNIENWDAGTYELTGIYTQFWENLTIIKPHRRSDKVFLSRKSKFSGDTKQNLFMEAWETTRISGANSGVTFKKVA